MEDAFMNTLKNKTLLLPVTASLLLALAGCGGAQEAPTPTATPTQESETTATQAAPATPVEALIAPEAKEIFPKVSAALRSATSVSIDADMTRGSESAKVKLSGTRDGSNSRAQITRDGATVELLTADGGSYVKADQKFFTQNVGKDAAKMVDSLAHGKWISVKDTSQFGDLSIGTLLESLGAEDIKESDLGKMTGKSVVDLNGAKAFKYTAKKGILWIAAEGDPYLLQMEPKDSTGKDSGTVSFAEWNAVKPHTAPSKAETVAVPGL
ncbi:hypothetical protein [Paeniglutamicibacter cryotolerans]|uniref:LppX_LprAFG lipoprotein n=1 Tax=Paeniglutamicibacter cryotolerans TaxID=670079 RepID=A0A839QQI6_9MICC|nr:hypothetical protein [Paeniglutamicibacter cryotolerans]MBB2996256.1 hypothetical protein [Paeniglutamicibacter cryotolerans]